MFKQHYYAFRRHDGWSMDSLNPGIATINALGVVTGVSINIATINYTFTNGNGCSTTVSTPITVNALPAVAPITGNFNICTSSTSPLADATTGGAWISGNTGVATIDINTGIVTGVAPGTATISYAVTNGNGCTTIVTADVTVTTLPSVAPITGPASVCEGNTISLADATTGGTWSTSDPTIATVSASGVVTGVMNGTADISYTITTTCGENPVAVQTITVNTTPTVVVVSGGGAYCGGTTITASGGTGGTIYFQGTTSGGTSTATPSSSEVISTSGTYYFRAQSAGGCWGAQGSVTVTINAIPAAVTVNGAGTFCGNTTITATGGTGGTIYFEGTTSGGTSTATPSSSQVISASGTYYFRSQSAAGCWGTEGSVTVTINPPPTVVTVTGAGTYCGSTTINATGGTGGTIYFQGTTSGGTSTTTPSASQVVSTSGTYYFRSQSAAGCWGPEGSVTVTVNALPTGVISGTTAICNSNSATLTLTVTGSGTISGTLSDGSTFSGTAPTITKVVTPAGYYYLHHCYLNRCKLHSKRSGQNRKRYYYR